MAEHLTAGPRRTTRESAVLAPLAVRRGMLESAVRKLRLESAVADAEALQRVIGPEVLDEVRTVTGLSKSDAAELVLEQLESVAEFVRTDGEPTSADFAAVEQLVKSGRGQLFVSGSKSR